VKGCERQSAGKPNIKPAGHDSCHPSRVILGWFMALGLPHYESYCLVDVGQ